MKWLLDTNVLSEGERVRPDSRVTAWTGGVNIDDTAISIVSLAEIVRGISLTADESRRQRLMRWLDGKLRLEFRGRTLAIDERTLVFALDIVSAGRAAGRPYSIADTLIGATARAHGLTVVTRNVRDFVPMGVPVLDPWTL